MVDPLGLVTNTQAMSPAAGAPKAIAPGGPSFRDTLVQNLAKVNELQQDAAHAMEDLAAGRRSDVEGVLLATQKADTAFRMLLAVRNKVMDAYQEIQQIRV